MSLDARQSPTLECKPSGTTVFKVIPSVGGELEALTHRFEPGVEGGQSMGNTFLLGNGVVVE
jgi:hypothetical protein